MKTASDVISNSFVRPIVLKKRVKFHDPRLNSSREIHPKPSETAFSTEVFRNNFRPEAVDDVISDADAEQVSMDVRVKLGDSRSNGSQDIRLLHFVMDERRRRRLTRAYAGQHKRPKHHTGVMPNNG